MGVGNVVQHVSGTRAIHAGKQHVTVKRRFVARLLDNAESVITYFYRGCSRLALDEVTGNGDLESTDGDGRDYGVEVRRSRST